MKTKFFKVAKSGKTIDGREITRDQIDQMASGYDPAKYGARIWVEHLRSFLPDSPFKAYGDVLALKAEDDADGQRALFAQVDATIDLVKLNADRQKVYWSIELDPNFQGGGQAYMVGLAITDSPASTGTEMLKFNLSSAAVNSPAKAHLFSTHVEGGKLEEAAVDTSFSDKIKSLFGATRSHDTRFTQVETAIETVAGEMGKLKEAVTALSAGQSSGGASAADLKKVSDQLASLTEAFNKHSPTDQRNKSGGGGDAANMTDC